MVPSEPQSIDSLQFILNQKPLGATAVVPASGKKDDAVGARLLMLSSSSVPAATADCHQSNGMEVRTAEEAREKARMKLEELNDIVQSASGLVGALSVAAKRHLSAASAAADVSSPSSSSSALSSLQLPVAATVPRRSQAHGCRAALLIAMATAKHDQTMNSAAAAAAGVRRNLMVSSSSAAAAAVLGLSTAAALCLAALVAPEFVVGLL